MSVKSREGQVRNGAIDGRLSSDAYLAAAPCKDAKGKFVTWPPPAAAPAAKYRNAKGVFAICGAPGAKPA